MIIATSALFSFLSLDDGSGFLQHFGDELIYVVAYWQGKMSLNNCHQTY